MTRIRAATLCSLLLFGAAPVGAQAFGGPLTVSGDQVFIGEARNQTLPGIVYVYEAEGDTWIEVSQMMIASDLAGGPDGFGQALSADGQTLLVGAPLESDGTGAAYMYRRGAGGWSQTARLRSGDGDAEIAFGSAAVLRGDLALVGAPGDRGGTGAVYVFRRASNGEWTRDHRIQPVEGREGARFGAAMALAGRDLLVASPPSRSADGTVHAFRMGDAGVWIESGRLEAPDLGERSGFGSSIGIRNGRAYVGAPGAAQRAGAVVAFAYETETGTWEVADRLGPFVSLPNTRFGASIAFDGSSVWVGAPGDLSGSGTFYVYARDAGGEWSGVTRLASGMDAPGAGFGSTVAMAGDLAVVGAGGVDSRAGAAVVLERTGGGWTERNMLVNEMRGYAAISGDEVTCRDDEAAGFACNEVNIVSFLPIKDMGGTRGTRVNDIWGWTDPQTGREYAIIGRTDGTSFVDLTDPAHPEYLGDLPKTEGSRSSIWRDMKVYRDHVYIVADAANQHGVQVFDLRQLRTLRNPPAVFEPTFLYDGIASAHNIVINEQTGYAYSVGSSSGGETCGGGLHMMSLENPARPTFAGCFADPSTGRRKTGYSHDAQCVAYHGPDPDHQGKEICLGSNETALNIADVTDKANPVTIATISYPNVAYTHQGWLTEDHRFFYQGDEGDEPQGTVAGTRTLVWDLTDLDDPVLAKEYIAKTTETDHNLYVRGNTMYQSNYGAGLRILDVSDPGNPVEIGFFDTTPYGGMGSWSNYPFFESGLVIATSGSEGLFVLKNTARPVLVP